MCNQNFLIVRPDRIGDAIISQVAIDWLATITGAQIDVLATNYNYQFYKNNPHIRQIFIADVENKSKLCACVAAIKNQYTAVFLFQARRRLYSAVASIAAPKFAFKLHFDRRLSSKIFSWYLALRHNFSYITHDATIHEAKNLQALIYHGLQQLQIKIDNKIALASECKIYNHAVNDPQDYSVDNINQYVLTQVPQGNKRVVINISGKVDEHKNLQPQLIAELLHYLLMYATDVGVVCTIDDYASVQKIIDDVCENIKQPQAKIRVIHDANIWLIAKQIKNYEYYIGADGGLLHIAAALGLYCIGLYSDTAKSLWYPWTTRQTTLSASDPYLITASEIINCYTLLLTPMQR